MEHIAKGIFVPMSIWEDTNLNWLEKVLLMEIDSYTKEGRGYNFPINFLASFLQCDAITAQHHLDYLISRGYVLVVGETNGLKYIRSNITIAAPAPEPAPEEQSLAVVKAPAFNFQAALIGIGVTEDTAKEFIKVRKAKKAVNTALAFDKIYKEILKTGMDAEHCIKTAVENSWKGFKAEWLTRQEQQSSRMPMCKEDMRLLQLEQVINQNPFK